jgi:hypothetical protein
MEVVELRVEENRKLTGTATNSDNKNRSWGLPKRETNVNYEKQTFQNGSNHSLAHLLESATGL